MEVFSVTKFSLVKSKITYYFQVVLKSYKAQATYRAQVFSKILYTVLLFLIQMYIWKSVNMANSVEIVNIDYMESYVLFSSLISVFIAFDMNYIPIIESKVKNGTISEELTRPVSFLLFNFLEYIGRCLFKFCFNAIPLMVIYFFIGSSNKIDFSLLGYYLIAIVGAVIIFFFINAICGMLSFWFVSIGGLHIIIDSSITLFSGAIIPLWLVPDYFRIFVEFLPFKYLFYYPISIMLGLQDKANIFMIYRSQALWGISLCLLSFIIYRKGIKRLQILG